MENLVAVESREECVLKSACVLSNDEVTVNGKKAVGYNIHISTNDGQSWESQKRYSDFLEVHNVLKANKEQKQEIVDFDFPKKEFGWYSFNKDVIEFRQGHFDAYVKLLATLDPLPIAVKHLFDMVDPGYTLDRQDSNLSVEPEIPDHESSYLSLPEIQEEKEDEEKETALSSQQINDEVTFENLEDVISQGETLVTSAPDSDIPFPHKQPQPTLTAPGTVQCKTSSTNSPFFILGAALSGFYPTFLLVLVFFILLALACYLESDHPDLQRLSTILGVTSVFTLAQPNIIPSRFVFLWLVMDACLVFSVLYFCLLIGYLSSPLGVLVSACALTFGLAGLQGLVFPRKGF